jgi:hypothetical protein
MIETSVRNTLNENKTPTVWGILRFYKVSIYRVLVFLILCLVFSILLADATMKYIAADQN